MYRNFTFFDADLETDFKIVRGQKEHDEYKFRARINDKFCAWAKSPMAGNQKPARIEAVKAPANWDLERSTWFQITRDQIATNYRKNAKTGDGADAQLIATSLDV